MSWPLVTTMETEELERRLHELECAHGLDAEMRSASPPSSLDPGALRWRREAHAELTRRHWTRVERVHSSARGVNELETH